MRQQRRPTSVDAVRMAAGVAYSLSVLMVAGFHRMVQL